MHFIDITKFRAAERGGVSTYLNRKGEPGRALRGQQTPRLEAGGQRVPE